MMGSGTYDPIGCGASPRRDGVKKKIGKTLDKEPNITYNY